MHPDVEILRAAIRVPTVADRDPALTDPEPFARLHALLAEHFPLLHAQVLFEAWLPNDQDVVAAIKKVLYKK